MDPEGPSPGPGGAPEGPRPPFPENYKNKFCLNNDEILRLAKWAIAIEEHYSKKAKKFKPMDMEWAKDGKIKPVIDKIFHFTEADKAHAYIQSRKNLGKVLLDFSGN